MKDPGKLVLMFGSHKGRTIEAIYKIDQKYVLWLRDECNAPSVREAASEFLREENKRIIERSKTKC